jgi:hypothetical protein
MRVDETEGILQVGEVPIIVRRDSRSVEDHTQAFRSGADGAYRKALSYVLERIASAPPYTDTRALTDMVVFLTDNIEEVASSARTAT